MVFVILMCVADTYVFSHLGFGSCVGSNRTGAPTHFCSLSMWSPWLLLCWPQIGVYLGTWLLVIAGFIESKRLLKKRNQSVSDEATNSDGDYFINNPMMRNGPNKKCQSHILHATGIVNFCGRIIAVRCSFVKRKFSYRICMIEILL